MSRADEIAARLDAAPAPLLWHAFDDLRYLLEERARLRAALETLCTAVDVRLLADKGYQDAANDRGTLAATMARLGDAAVDAIVAEHEALVKARAALKEQP